ncbi:MAG: tetratricopeptide repeat protein, partial [Candidatus Aminicenantales bacterium]
EFDKSLGFYDLALQVSPEYRDALLGKAICLSYLGRYEDAIRSLDRMLELGYWLLGEAHYWLAWNLHELKRDAEALRHIDEAKGRLPTNSEVFGLSGTISLETGELDRAEKDFLESLKYNAANSESLFGLGTVAGRKDRWEESGSYYEKAGRAFESAETVLKAKVEEIRGSALSGERKARLLRKRELQLDRVRTRPSRRPRNPPPTPPLSKRPRNCSGPSNNYEFSSKMCGRRGDVPEKTLSDDAGTDGKEAQSLEQYTETRFRYLSEVPLRAAPPRFCWSLLRIRPAKKRDCPHPDRYGKRRDGSLPEGLSPSPQP